MEPENSSRRPKHISAEFKTLLHMNGADPGILEGEPDLVGIVDVLEQYLQLFSTDVDIVYIIDELLASA
jgi:hypothetical protein